MHFLHCRLPGLEIDTCGDDEFPCCFVFSRCFFTLWVKETTVRGTGSVSELSCSKLLKSHFCFVLLETHGLDHGTNSNKNRGQEVEVFDSSLNIGVGFCTAGEFRTVLFVPTMRALGPKHNHRP